MGVVAAQTDDPRTLYCNALILLLSPRGFQLPTFHAGWCSSVVILFLSPRGFQLPVYLSSAVTSFLSPRGLQLPTFHAGWCSTVVILPFFSLGVSTANLSCWLVLIRCNLASLSSGVSAASLPLIRCNLSSGVSAAILSRSRVLFCCEVACLSLAV